MLVCENHRDKRWPDECECGPGMTLVKRDDALYHDQETGDAYALREGALKRVERRG